MVPRTVSYTYDANVWDSSIVQAPFSAVAPCQTLIVTIRNLFIAVRRGFEHSPRPMPGGGPPYMPGGSPPMGPPIIGPPIGGRPPIIPGAGAGIPGLASEPAASCALNAAATCCWNATADLSAVSLCIPASTPPPRR
jgi:hypothetical protein